MSFESPLSVLYDENGIALAVTASQVITGTQPGIVMMGSGSTGWEYFRLSPTGDLYVTGSIGINTTAVLNVSVSNQPIVDQGNAGSQAQGWFVKLTDGTNVLGTGSAAPVWVTGSVTTNISLPTTQSVKVDQWTTGVTASIREIGSSTTIVSSVNTTVTNYTVLAPNPNRRALYLFKDGANTCYVKFGATASSTSFTVRMTSNSFFENVRYTGQVDILFSSNAANNILYVTEESYP